LAGEPQDAALAISVVGESRRAVAPVDERERLDGRGTFLAVDPDRQFVRIEVEFTERERDRFFVDGTLDRARHLADGPIPIEDRRTRFRERLGRESDEAAARPTLVL